MSQRPDRVLVVDDTPENVLLIRAQLERAGYAVQTASSGRAALEAVAADPPDLVLLDLMMPGVDGYEVCRRLKAEEATRTIPIVVLTALQAREDKLRAFNEGADDFLTKPVDRAELLARVRSHLRAKSLYDELARERATLSAILGAMQDALVVVDVARDVRFCNRPAGELIGAAPEDLEGTDVRDVFARVAPLLEDPEGFRARWLGALAEGQGYASFEATVLRPIRRHLAVGVFPVTDPRGACIGWGTLLRDVTREREVQRLKDELVSIVSHELRTPLASIVGFAELLLSRPFEAGQQREFLEIMLEEGHRLTALINDFLDHPRLESGRQEIQVAPTAIGPVIERAVVMAGPDPRRPIVVDLPDDLPLVSIDADRVLQVLMNLLSNARKYSPDGGEIAVGARIADGTVAVSVRDHGLGLPPEAMPQLFEKFYRVDNSDRREISGTGLGLAICRQIVERQGGRIWAESDGLGRGSTFTFTVPVFDESPSNGDVLVVEDDHGFARLLSAELNGAGLTVTRAADAEDAIRRLGRTRPRAVVLDLILPDLPGEALLPMVRLASAERIPVVVVSVKELDQQQRAELGRQGAVAVLRKGPGVAGEAARTVLTALQRSTPGPVASGRDDNNLEKRE